MGKEQKTFEYQETMNVDIENISNHNNNNWRPIYEVIDKNISATKVFPA